MLWQTRHNGSSHWHCWRKWALQARLLAVSRQIEALLARGPLPNVVSFSAAISACEKSVQWMPAVSLPLACQYHAHFADDASAATVCALQVGEHEGTAASDGNLFIQ